MPRMSRASRLPCTLLALVAGCSPPSEPEWPATPFLVTDAALYMLRAEGPSYRTTIEFEMENTTGVVLSSARCTTVPPPVLEKKVDGRWVLAYAPVVPACRHVINFQVAPDEVFRHAFDIQSGRPGTTLMPQFEVEPIPGTYRLRWGLRLGPDPEAPGAALVHLVSNEFVLVIE